jgi:competence protein ComFC
MNILDRILGYLAPFSCISCGRQGSVICYACLSQVNTLPSICYICARATSNNTPCPSHKKTNGPKHAWICFAYSGLAKKVVWQYKFQHKRATASTIALFMHETMPYLEGYTVSFVPADSVRLRQRGFDHAKLIATELAKLRNSPITPLLTRQGHGLQHALTRQARLESVKGLYRAHAAAKGKKILLIDDVITTGATVNECAKQLYRAGATEVSVVAFARTPK